ncbi:MAG TPA: hypothetical protein VIL78_06520 [Hanamia sp.]
MRIYYQIGEAKYSSDDLGKAMAKSVSGVHVMAMELLKYKIMWALRSIEAEINNSDGVINIHSEALGSKTSISINGFSDELKKKIEDIASVTKF